MSKIGRGKDDGTPPRVPFDGIMPTTCTIEPTWLVERRGYGVPPRQGPAFCAVVIDSDGTRYEATAFRERDAVAQLKRIVWDEIVRLQHLTTPPRTVKL